MPVPPGPSNRTLEPLSRLNSEVDDSGVTVAFIKFLIELLEAEFCFAFE